MLTMRVIAVEGIVPPVLSRDFAKTPSAQPRGNIASMLRTYNGFFRYFSLFFRRRSGHYQYSVNLSWAEESNMSNSQSTSCNELTFGVPVGNVTYRRFRTAKRDFTQSTLTDSTIS